MSIKLRVIQWLAQRLPKHPDGHLWAADRGLYMGRWVIFNTRYLHLRLHHLATPDPDRDLHDHPNGFISLVLNGGYAEARPETVAPCFDAATGRERVEYTWRVPGSIALRHAGDRHKIGAVAPNTYTLFLFFGRRAQWWGYYTPRGKVYCHDYFKHASHKKAA